MTYVIATFIGSLRKASSHRAMFNYAQQAAKAHGIELREVDISNFTLYNSDVEATGIPADVTAAAKAVETADALLFFSPEYNYSITGVLKNAIDWISRTPRVTPVPMASPFFRKTAGVISGGGGFKGLRSQVTLRQIGVFLQLDFMPLPEVGVALFEGQKIVDGKLVDPTTQKAIDDYVLALKAYAQRKN
jgi:chromate reductase